ncbi:MAG: hypothetical protein ACXAB7_17620 [Candidatus Kariarchaeaceae archaeon]
MTDLLLLKQDVGYAHFKSSSTERIQSLYYHRRKTQGKECIGWIHSHGNMTPFLSATDHGQINSVYLHEINSVLSVVVSTPFVSKHMNNDLMFEMRCWVTFLNKDTKQTIEITDHLINTKHDFDNRDIPEYLYNAVSLDFRQLVKQDPTSLRDKFTNYFKLRNGKTRMKNFVQQTLEFFKF